MTHSAQTHYVENRIYDFLTSLGTYSIENPSCLLQWSTLSKLSDDAKKVFDGIVATTSNHDKAIETYGKRLDRIDDMYDVNLRYCALRVNRLFIRHQMIIVIDTVKAFILFLDKHSPVLVNRGVCSQDTLTQARQRCEMLLSNAEAILARTN